MNFSNYHIKFKGNKRIIFILIVAFVFAGTSSIAQIDSRNQAKPTKEQNDKKPKKKIKRVKSKKSPRQKGKKIYSNRKQINKAKRSRAKNVEKSPKGDITGRRVKPKKTPRRTVARPQPDTYKNRRIRTEKSRVGPAAPAVRTATKKGEKARTGDISGRKTVRQRSVKSSRRTPYVQPNPYTGRKVKTEKRRAKSNTRELRSIRSVSKPSESRRPQTRSRPVTATVAPKIRTKKNVYRSHERTGGEKSTDKDISGRKLRTKNKRTVRRQTGARPYASVSPYRGRKRYSEGQRFKRSRSLPASARSISRSSESYRRNNNYPTRKNYRTPRSSTVVKAKSVRSTADPSRRGEKPIFGKKYRPGSTRSISGQRQASRRRSPGPPVTLSGQRRRYAQKNTYQGKDRHFGENSTDKDIAGRRLRTRNYRSSKPNGAVSGFMPYYGRSAPKGSPKRYADKGGRRSNRGRWNNNGSPIFGKGRGPNQEAASAFKGKMPLSALPGFGGGKEGSYRGNIPARKIRKYGAGTEGSYSGRIKSSKPLVGGGSVSRHWNNKGQPIFGRGRSANGEAISRYRGKMPLSAMPSYGQSGESSYRGNIPAKNIRKYGAGLEGSYSGNRRAQKPLTGGGGSITRHWNNKGQPILGRGRGASGEAISKYSGKLPMSAMPSYGRSKEGAYAGKMKAKKPITGGGGSITRHWNNNNQPLPVSGRNANSEAIFNYSGKVKVEKNGGYKYSGEDYGRRKKLLVVYFGHEGGNMVAAKKSKKYNSVEIRGRTRSLTFLKLGNPTQGGLRREYANTSRNRNLPKNVKGSDRIRLSAAKGTERGRTTTLSFISLGNPTRGGLVYSPSKAKGRLHPSSKYTQSSRTRNSAEEKDQPIKLRIWWAKLFNKNASQPNQVKNKSRRPRYDKGEREIWETAEREDWYKN